jgi:hypothetical protein
MASKSDIDFSQGNFVSICFRVGYVLHHSESQAHRNFTVVCRSRTSEVVRIIGCWTTRRLQDWSTAMEPRVRSKSKQHRPTSPKLVHGLASSLAVRLAEVRALREQVQKAEARQKIYLRSLPGIHQSASVGLF